MSVGEFSEEYKKIFLEIAEKLNEEHIIDIYEGWSNDDPSDTTRYWMFSAQLPLRNSFCATGRGGLILYLKTCVFPNVTFIYNGKKIPQEEKQKFLDYINNLADEEE